MKPLALMIAAATMTAPGLENDAWPPSRFTMPLAGVTVSFVGGIGDPQLDSVCGKIDLPKYHFGCSNKGGRWILIVSPCSVSPSDDYARQLCHELAHLNGWPGDHPQ